MEGLVTFIIMLFLLIALFFISWIIGLIRDTNEKVTNIENMLRDKKES